MASITLQGNPLKTAGELPKIGSQAPDFTLTKVDLTEIQLKDFLGKRVILSIFPSVDTGTCANAERHFNEEANQLKNTVILCISADLPFAQKRFCAAESLTHVMPASTFRHPQFGKSYGVTILEGPMSGLLSRAIVILDEQGKVIYTEQVAELSKEPSYPPILAVLK
ncbi:MAG: hypothetical protein ACD_60C00038G0039 [uncultured bacterium]|nr:MAG: hypothetical protein ACD_60C00038G0039 [uncultured bacterium]